MSGQEPPNNVTQFVHQALLSDALMFATTAAFLLDDAGHYVAVNDAACELTGFDRHEILGLEAGLDLAGDHLSKETYRDVVRAARLQGTASLRKRDGEIISVHYLTTQTTVGHLPYVLSLCWEADG